MASPFDKAVIGTEFSLSAVTLNTQGLTLYWRNIYKLIIVKYLYSWDLLCVWLEDGRELTVRYKVVQFNHNALLQWSKRSVASKFYIIL